MSIPLQETIDRFLLHLQNQEPNDPEWIQQCEQIFQFLSEYLIYYSDLFQAEEFNDDSPMQAWEESLESFVSQLIEGESEQNLSLEDLPLDNIDGDYLRDFMGWHLLREPSSNSLMVQYCAECLQAWLTFCHEQSWLQEQDYQHFINCVQDTLPDAKRAAVAAHLLLYHIRLGGSISPRLRGKRFTRFKEGHARIAAIEPKQLWLSFDSEPEHKIGPVLLPEMIVQQLRLGDVIDIEIGQRGDTWAIVDIGPVYPAMVYVEATEMDLPDKLM
ncbi:MAG: hypothetical protein Q9M19_00170 [Mariprofundaceae bacterium]|nr:hypothetical protein [Mariprofundaceae bacterium]